MVTLVLRGQGGPQRLPRQAGRATAAVQGVIRTETGLGLSGARVVLRNQTTGSQVERTTPGDGVFLLPDLIPGAYLVTVTRDGFQTLSPPIVQLSAGETRVLDLTLLAVPAAEPLRRIPGSPATLPPPPEESAPSPYRELRQRPPAESVECNTVPPEPLPDDSKIFTPVPNRWQYEFPKYRRYPGNGDIQYVEDRRFDPFNRNKAKGDYPIFGNRTFLNLTVTSDTFFDRRVLPVPSGVGSAGADSSQFFGNFGQYALSENVAVSATLFQGDTAFRPIDWQVRFTPEFNFNYLAVQENGIVNIDVRKGTTRYDQHAGLQEAFVEARLKNLSNDYDFVSARAGIQSFNSDFRGFIFFD